MDTLDKSEQTADSNNVETPTMPDQNQNDFLSSSPESINTVDLEKGYKVLARKYRPQNFDDLMGQEVMVQTLKNAFKIFEHSESSSTNWFDRFIKFSSFSFICFLHKLVLGLCDAERMILFSLFFLYLYIGWKLSFTGLILRIILVQKV